MSKPELTYTLIGEGFAEYQFLPFYVEQIVQRRHPELQVVRTKIQIAISKQSSSSKVLQYMELYCAQSFADPKISCDLFIVGVDLDKPDHTDDLEYHGECCRNLVMRLGKMHTLFGDKIILVVPIQAVDYWLAYQHLKATPNSLESQTKDEIKKKVYGLKEPNRPTIEKKAKAIAEKADFDELAKQSRSFAHFHKQIVGFLETFAISPS